MEMVEKQGGCSIRLQHDRGDESLAPADVQVVLSPERIEERRLTGSTRALTRLRTGNCFRADAALFDAEGRCSTLSLEIRFVMACVSL